jgi:hypothetical protein
MLWNPIPCVNRGTVFSWPSNRLELRRLATSASVKGGGVLSLAKPDSSSLKESQLLLLIRLGDLLRLIDIAPASEEYLFFVAVSSASLITLLRIIFWMFSLL